MHFMCMTGIRMVQETGLPIQGELATLQMEPLRSDKASLCKTPMFQKIVLLSSLTIPELLTDSFTARKRRSERISFDSSYPVTTPRARHGSAFPTTDRLIIRTGTHLSFSRSLATTLCLPLRKRMQW